MNNTNKQCDKRLRKKNFIKRNYTTRKGGFLSSLMRDGAPLLENVLTQLAKEILLPLEFTASSSIVYPAIQTKILESGMTTSKIL